MILVDELAHTNAPGVTHTKRWQDVERLLQAGIDVYTTLNVQHLESLNDVIAQITGVIVRETVPDAIFDRSDEVELVDLPPDDLIERLREGKVYLPDQASRAIESFFKKGNLIALRELALRRMAERVNAQMQDYRSLHAVARTWPTSERLLVSVGPSPHSARGWCALPAAWPTTLRAPWVAVYVETAQSVRLSKEDADRIGADAAPRRRAGRRDGHDQRRAPGRRAAGLCPPAQRYARSSSASRNRRGGKNGCAARSSTS